jgi:hypothetical protein
MERKRDFYYSFTQSQGLFSSFGPWTRNKIRFWHLHACVTSCLEQ